MTLNTQKPLIDNISQHETPEGVLLTLMPAGLMPRALAWFLDFAIRIGCIAAMSIPLALLSQTGAGLFSIIYFLLEWLYPVYFEVFRGGATPGKKHIGIYVCHDDGTPITLQSSMTRNLLRVADFLPMLFVSATVTMLITKKSQRIGDVVAGTIVAYKEQDDVKKVFNSVYGKLLIQDHTATGYMGSDHSSIDRQHRNNYPTQQPSNTMGSRQFQYSSVSPLFVFSLTFKEQASLLSLSDRLSLLPKQRQYELTHYLAPLVDDNALSDNDKNQAVHHAVLTKSQQIRGGVVHETTAI